MKIERRRPIHGEKVQMESLESLIVDTAAAARPPERLTVSEASEKYRKLNNPGSYVGPWLNDTVPYLVEPMDVLQDFRFTGMVFAGPAQCGKSLAVDTPIATPSGWTTMGEIEVGDFVFGANGKPTRVVIANPVQIDRPCYRITFDEGSEIIADAEHRWLVRDCNRPGERVVTTQEMADSGVSSGKRARYRIRVAEELDTEKKDLLLDPYVLGVWLGDGSELYGYISVGKEDSDAMVAELAARGYRSRVYKPSAQHRCYALGVRGPDGVFIDQYLSTMGLGGGKGKCIPEDYLRASKSQRRELLRGLCDTDGCLSGTHKRAVQFVSVDEKLARQVAELARSLGLKARLRFKSGPGRGSWNVLFSIYRGSDAFSLPRKVGLVTEDAPSRPGETSARFIRSIESVDTVPVRCIGVDAGDHLFLAGEGMIPTHNTDTALNWLLYSVVCDPADMMIVQTTGPTARDFSIRRIDRLHRHSPAIGDKLAIGKQGDNTFDKNYRGGMLLTLSWPSINELSGKPIPRLWLTDYDRMPENIDGEGSPFDLARKRATSFRSFGMCAAESSPGFTVENPKWVRKTPHEAPPTRGILSLYNRGDRRRWYWRCVVPTCGKTFEPSFDMLEYPNSADKMESAEMAVLRCPHCRQAYSHEPAGGLPGKHEMNRHGKWIKDGMRWTKDGEVGTPIRSDIASFWLKGVAAAFSDWKSLVFNYLSAEEDYESTQSEESLKTTVNTDQGEPYVPKSMKNDRDPTTIQSRAVNLGERVVPQGVRFLVATIDVQKNRFVVQVHGVSGNKDVYVIDRFEIKKSKRLDEDGERRWVAPGSHLEDWKVLGEAVIARRYPLADESGREMGIKLTLSDSGGREGVTENAYNFVRWLRRGDQEIGDEETEGYVEKNEDYGEYDWQPEWASRFMLLKGNPILTSPRVQIVYPDSQRKDRTAGARGEIPVLLLNSDVVKDMVNNRLDRVDPGGRFVFPNWLDTNFFIELTVEIKDAKKGWINPKKFRNESWDLLAYCLAANLSPMILLEHMDMNQAPSWAAPWDENDLVFNPASGSDTGKAEKKASPIDALAKLAGDLG